MAITLGRLVGLGFFLFWIAMTLSIVTLPMDWAEWVTTNAETAGQLIRAVFIGAMLWIGARSYGKIGSLVDDVVKLWAVWNTKKKKSE